jgi:hypothetical protein
MRLVACEVAVQGKETSSTTVHPEMTDHVRQPRTSCSDVYSVLGAICNLTLQTAAMPAHRAGRNAQRPRPSAFDRPPYLPAQSRATTDGGASHPTDPASSDAAHPPGPLPILQASAVSDTVSMDDVSRGITERDSPSDPADWAACEQDERTSCAQDIGLPPAKLELLDWSEWDRNKVYDERPPTCLHYSIVWKITLNNKLICKDTEQDLVLAPQYHWSFILLIKLRMLVQKKLSKHGKVTVLCKTALTLCAEDNSVRPC